MSEYNTYSQRFINESNYSLSLERQAELMSDFLKDEPSLLAGRYVTYRLPEGDIEDVARTVECRVFDQAFDEGASKMSEIYGPYESQSHFYLAVDRENKLPTGVLRVIEDDAERLMTINSLPPEATKLTPEEILAYHGVNSFDTCWDIGTVAVLPEYRQKGVNISIQLYRSLYKDAMNHGVKHMFSIIDRKPYETMTKYLGIPFLDLADSKPFSFEGSKESVAVYGYVPDFFKKMSRQTLHPRGIMAARHLIPLVFGTKDRSINLK